MRFTSARSFPFFVGMLVSLLPLALQHQALAVTGDSRDAQAAFERKDYDTAVRLLNSLLAAQPDNAAGPPADRKSTRLNSSHLVISYAVFCLKKKKKQP